MRKYSMAVLTALSLCLFACSNDSTSVSSQQPTTVKSTPQKGLASSKCPADTVPFPEEAVRKYNGELTGYGENLKYMETHGCSEWGNRKALENSAEVWHYYVCEDDVWREVHKLEYLCFEDNLNIGDECVVSEDDSKKDVYSAYVYTECGWEKKCSTADDAGCVKRSVTGDGSLDLETFPVQACTKANELEHIKLVTHSIRAPIRYFVCKDGAWELTGRTEYECPSENAKVGDVCEYFNDDSTVYAWPGHAVKAHFTADGWDAEELTLAVNVYTGTNECTDENEGAIDSVFVPVAIESISHYDYFKCADNKWHAISEEQRFCSKEGQSIGDTCTYTVIYGTPEKPNCQKNLLEYWGDGYWDAISIEDCEID